MEVDELLKKNLGKCKNIKHDMKTIRKMASSK